VTDQPAEDQGTEAAAPARRERRKRTRAELDAIFGDVVPTQTSDDRDGPGEPGTPRGDPATDDERIRREVPPHHGS
jgi:hypothetical protein